MSILDAILVVNDAIGIMGLTLFQFKINYIHLIVNIVDNSIFLALFSIALSNNHDHSSYLYLISEFIDFPIIFF